MQKTLRRLLSYLLVSSMLLSSLATVSLAVDDEPEFDESVTSDPVFEPSDDQNISLAAVDEDNSQIMALADDPTFETNPPTQSSAAVGTVIMSSDPDAYPPFNIQGYVPVGGNIIRTHGGGVTNTFDVTYNPNTGQSDTFSKLFNEALRPSFSELKQKFMEIKDNANSNEKSSSEMVGIYMQTLAYLDWLSKNWWTDAPADGESGSGFIPTKYSVLNLPLGESEDIPPILVDQIKEVLDFLDEISQTMVNNDTYYPSSTKEISEGNGTDTPVTYVWVPSYGKYSIIGGNWGSSVYSDITIGNRLAGTYTFNMRLELLVRNYLDASLLYTLAKVSGKTVADNMSYDDLITSYGNFDAWKEYAPNLQNSESDPSDTSNKYKGLAEELMKNFGDDIQVYLDKYTTVRDLILKLNDYGFSDVKNGDNKYLGWHRNDNDTHNNADFISSWISPIFDALVNNKVVLSSESKDPALQQGVIEEIDVSNGVFGLMVKGGKIENGEVKVEGKKEDADLSDIGHAILAAGAVYDPFISIAGNDGWLNVVKRFLPSESQEDVAKILKVALNTKKPLYVTDGDNSSWVVQDSVPDITSADYRYAFLADALQIEEDVTRAYVVVKGDMSPSQVDGSTWEYVNKDTDISSRNTSTEVHVDSGNATNEIAVDASLDKKGDITGNWAVDMLKTAASSVLSASDYQVTTPVMITSGFKAKWWGEESKGYSAAVGGLTSVILENAKLDTKDNPYIQKARTEQLFLNGLGDIVLMDGTVILPAISNPVLYNYTSPDNSLWSSESEFLKAIVKDTGFIAYYPYTASLMNHYPAARILPNGKLGVDADTDESKYLFVFDSKDQQTWGMTSLFAKKIEKAAKDTGEASMAQLGSVRVASFVPNCFRVQEDNNESVSIMSVAQGDAGATWLNWLSSGINIGYRSTFGFIASFGERITGGGDGNVGQVDTAMERKHMNFVTRNRVSNEKNMSFFPLHDDSVETREAFLDLGGAITNSAMRYITYNTLSNGEKRDAKTFRMSTYIFDFVAEGLLGTQYTSALVKNSQISYEQLVDDQAGRFTKWVIQLTDAAADTLGRIDGVLAIKGPYDNPFFNKIFNFIQDFYFLLCIVLLVITAAKFFKGHFNLLYVAFIGVLCVAGFEVYANWLPTLVPQLYNFAVNDTIENVVWNTTFYNAERYSDTYRNADNVDPETGALHPYTGTITLYKLTNAEMREVANRTGVDYEKIKKGQIIHLDNDAGIFIQGNTIKMSIDRLLVNNSMRGLYKSQWDQLGTEYTGTEDILLEDVPRYNGNPYSIQLIQPIVSLEAYYTPYDHFERSLISQLNQFANYFMIERHMFIYGEGDLYKDAFMVNSFVNSGIFTAPGDAEVLRQNVNIDTVTVDINDPAEAFADHGVDELVKMVQEAFVPEEDWLGIVKVFAEPDVGVQNSLWGYVMRTRGWYDYNWKMTPEGDEALSDLIRYINRHTKLWVINNLDSIQSLSDENAIKMISLYATTCFTHRISQVGEWMYPNYINASDIELKDVLYGSMVTLKDKNFAYDGTVVNTVSLNIGVFGVLFLLFIILFASLFIFVITYMIPILYGLLGGIIIFKLVNSNENIGVIKGYVKVTLTSAVLYFLFSLSLQIVSFSGYRWYSYLGCMLCVFLCDYFLFWVVLSVCTNPLEMGNETLARNLLLGLDKITRGSVSKINAKVANISNNSSNPHFQAQVAYQYARAYDIDNYGRPHGHRTHVGDTGYNRHPDYSRPDDYMGRRTFNGYGRDNAYEENLGATQSNRHNHTSRNRRGWRGGLN